MSVADSPFDSAWRVAKAPFYHSVNTDTSDPEVANKLFQLRDELMAEGITFDAGGMVGGGRDWELDWSLKGATPDEVMARMRDAGIPFTSIMRYEEEGDEKLSNRPDTDDEGNPTDDEMAEADRFLLNGRSMCEVFGERASGICQCPKCSDADYEDGGVIIGSVKCPECKGDAMVIRENDDVKSFTLGCNDCGYTEPDYDYRFQSFDKSFTKFDQQRAEMARAVEQEQIPAEDEEVNVDLNPNGGEPDKCCLEALQLYQELTGDYTQSNPWIWSKGVEGGTDGLGGGELDCDELRSWLEWLVYDDPEAELMGDEDLAPKAKKVLEQWESCISEGFSGDFTASGDSFEDAWGITKFDADRAMQARTLDEQEEETAPIINLEPPLDSGDDPCCVNAKNKWIEGLREIFGMDDSSFVLNESLSGVNQNIIDGYESMSCEEFIETLRDFAGHMPGVYHRINVTDRKPGNETPEHWLARRILDEYDECVAEMTMGSSDAVDMYRSGDSFEDAWSVAKNLNPSAGFPRKRCWLCERVKDTYGAYPELPWYPPNWNRPCDCSGGV
jgi:Zn ribbon nucleic-acid-binding protein